ncbi:hypothetical protein [Flavobacterium selenitireducens]|uniref:hypothetical protein n=1 Tax=Flavobacterium selenitireducens TaxID=2722704 RepID=UPI00168A97C3|nr:hypothetical protein [Flavobacterium selenitireducens]MBD3582752.1 hypothetical protein [Flavobacterium selenitireducens]
MGVFPIPTDRIRYTLSHKTYGSFTLPEEPSGWDTDEKEYARNVDYHGIFAKFSNALKFKGESKDFIQMIEATEGINARPRLLREERHPVTDIWTRSYEGYLDLTTREISDDTLSIKFSSGGLEPILKARESEAVELDRLSTMDGKPIDPMTVEQVSLDGRRILLTSIWEISRADNIASTRVRSNGGTRYQSTGVPFELIERSHEEAQSVIPESHGNELNGTTGMMLIAKVDRPRTFRVKMNLTFTTNVFEYDHVNHGWYGLFFGKYSNGESYDSESRIEIFRKEKVEGQPNQLLELGGTFGSWFDPNNIAPATWNVAFDDTISLDTGQSLSLEFLVRADLGNATHRGHLGIKAQDIKGKCTIIEDSFYEKSKAKFFLMYDVFERLAEIMTGSKKNFRSRFFGRTDKGYAVDGPGAHTGITHGFWLRGFDKHSVIGVQPWQASTYTTRAAVTFNEITYVLAGNVPIPFQSTNFTSEKNAGKWILPSPAISGSLNEIVFDLGDISGQTDNGELAYYINENGDTYPLTNQERAYFFRYIYNGVETTYRYNTADGGLHVYGAGTGNTMLGTFLTQTTNIDSEPNPFKPLATSFKDCENSNAAIWNTGLGIERVGFEEKIVVEDLRYFYNPNVTVRLPNQISKVKRTVSTKHYFSSIEIGYEKGGNYEEAMGLDEYNGKTTFSTVITALKNSYSALSAYRGDSYGKEFARRKPKTQYPTTDTQYDDDIFYLDLKKTETEIFKERLWFDGPDALEEPPTGTYSPETATNLRLSPFNMMLRHGWYIAAGLVKYPMDYIRYASSTANSSLTTKMVGQHQYSENGNILNSELSRPRFVPEIVEFEHVCDFGIMQIIDGKSIINGQQTLNIYGLIEFTNEDGQPEKGWLISLKPNGAGKWQVLKYNSQRQP